MATLARRRFRPFSEDSYSVESYGPGSQPVIGAEADLEVAAPPVAMYPRETTDWARTATAGESRDEDTERPARASREEAQPTPTAFSPGDFVLVRGHALTSFLIRLGQRLRLRGEDKDFAYWNHAALLVSDGGDIVEALGRGVVERNLTAYQPNDYKIVRLKKATKRDREKAVLFANWAAGKVYSDGLPVGAAQRKVGYSFLAILSIAFRLVGMTLFLGFAAAGVTLLSVGETELGLVFVGLALVVLVLRSIRFSRDGHMICSCLVARSIERCGFIFGWRDVSHVRPGGLAKAFGVRP